jgi:AcrR family transcriptional regulator
MPKGFTDHEKDLIRKRLIDQGYKLFSIYGLRKTNVEEIAKAAGISKGAFYNFYEIKEALFMDIIEDVELRARMEILAAIDIPGKTPRARLYAIFKKAFSLLESLPILQFLTGNEAESLFRRVPVEKLQEHMASDQLFVDELINKCRDAGIPIRMQSEQIIGLFYPLVISMLHKDDLKQENINSSFDTLLELIAAYCLGELETIA